MAEEIVMSSWAVEEAHTGRHSLGEGGRIGTRIGGLVMNMGEVARPQMHPPEAVHCTGEDMGYTREDCHGSPC